MRVRRSRLLGRGRLPLLLPTNDRDAVDVWPEMHDLYRGEGVPENVEVVTERVDDLPSDADRFGSPFATSYHPDSPGRRCSTY